MFLERQTVRCVCVCVLVGLGSSSSGGGGANFGPTAPEL